MIFGKPHSLAAGALAFFLLAAAAAAQAQLAPGSSAPDFAVPAALGGKTFEFRLAQARQKGPVVVYFYPKAFTKGCSLEARAFAEAMDEYAALSATVIGISGDDMATLEKFSVAECASRFAVGSDAHGSVMQAWQAVLHKGEKAGGGHIARRVSYVVTPAGKVAYHYASGNHEQHVPNTLAAIRAWRDQEGAKNTD